LNQLAETELIVLIYVTSCLLGLALFLISAKPKKQSKTALKTSESFTNNSFVFFMRH